MKLILQAIKSLLRKLRTEISGLRSGITRLERKQSKATEDIASLRTDLTKTDFIAKDMYNHPNVAVGICVTVGRPDGSIGWQISNYDKFRWASANPIGNNSTAILMDTKHRLIPLVDTWSGDSDEDFHPAVFSLIVVEDNELVQHKYVFDPDKYPALESLVYTKTVLLELNQ